MQISSGRFEIKIYFFFVIMQSNEIGIGDVWISWKDTVDPPETLQ